MSPEIICEENYEGTKRTTNGRVPPPRAVKILHLEPEKKTFWCIFEMKEIINVNRRIILFSKICYDKINDYGQLCTFLPNYWPWSLWKVLFTWFYISDRLLGCQEQPLLERYAWNLNMFASMSFVNTICLWKPHTFMWQNLEERDIWLALQQILWLLKGVFTELSKNSHSFIIWFDFSDSIKGSFAIDTQMPIVLFFGQSVYVPSSVPCMQVNKLYLPQASPSRIFHVSLRKLEFLRLDNDWSYLIYFGMNSYPDFWKFHVNLSTLWKYGTKGRPGEGWYGTRDNLWK